MSNEFLRHLNGPTHCRRVKTRQELGILDAIRTQEVDFPCVSARTSVLLSRGFLQGEHRLVGTTHCAAERFFESFPL